MDARTETLWAGQNRHDGDRLRLFSAIANAVEADRVLYPGSFVDVAPSMLFDHVTYVDNDKRVPGFFADDAGVREIVDAERESPEPYDIVALHADYQDELPIEDASFDMLVSLYAGFVSEHCTRYLRVGGTLVVNSSHGDASMASIDDRYELAGVITLSRGAYTFSSNALDSYFVQKRSEPITVERLHHLGRAIAYTKSPFAYLFTRTS